VSVLDFAATASAALARSGDPEGAVSAILEIAVLASGAAGGAVFVQDPDRPEFSLIAGHGIDGDEATALAAAAADETHPLAVAARERTAAVGEGLAVLPLAVSRGGIDLPLGVVCLRLGGSGGLDGETERLAHAAADLIAVAVDRDRLASLVAERAEWFERMAHTDPLTGLANQRTFDRVLELELARAGRQGSMLAVGILDVDRFVDLNEQAGREAGDDALRAVASVLAESVRLVDTVARYGGDEFGLVAPGSAGQAVARRVALGLAKLEPVGGRPISVSIGLATFPTDGATAEELLEAARQALARAKSAGEGSIEEARTEPAS
jgi:diguanylate cyclase (GGDEF)-like protein